MSYRPALNDISAGRPLSARPGFPRTATTSVVHYAAHQGLTLDIGTYRWGETRSVTVICGESTAKTANNPVYSVGLSATQTTSESRLPNPFIVFQKVRHHGCRRSNTVVPCGYSNGPVVEADHGVR